MKKQIHKKKASLNSPRNLTFIIACVALLLAIYILFTITTKKTSPVNNGSLSNNNVYPTTDPAMITAALSFFKNPDKRSANINIITGKQAISGIQFALSYDPKALQNVSVTSGNFFKSPVVLQNAIDTKNGIIYYTLAINPNSAQIYGEGTVAVLHYGTLSSGAATKVSFLPQTKITSKGVNDSVLKQASSMQLP